MRRYGPREIVELLRSARTEPGGADLQGVLAEFAANWRRLAKGRWPWLVDHHDDAISIALNRICERIDELEDDLERVRMWANGQFIAVMDVIRKRTARERQRTRN